MGRPYTMDLRERVVAVAVERGMSRRQAARVFSVSPTAVINWMKRFCETGSVAPGQMGGTSRAPSPESIHAGWSSGVGLTRVPCVIWSPNWLAAA